MLRSLPTRLWAPSNRPELHGAIRGLTVSNWPIHGSASFHVTQIEEKIVRSPISPFSGEPPQDPYPFYSWLRENSPVYKVPETGHYMVASHKLIEEVCKKPEIFSSRISNILRKSEDGELHPIRKYIIDFSPGSI
jgi:cytochrome P450